MAMSAPGQLFLLLVTAHLIADFTLQTDRDIANKRRPLWFAKLLGLVTLPASLVTGWWTQWIIPAVILVTHAAIDLTKLAAERRGWSGPIPFILDQVAHVAVLAGLAWWLGEASAGQLYAPARWGSTLLELSVVLSGGIVAVLAGGYLIALIVRDAAESEATRARSRVAGGMAIGQGERILVFALVLTGYAWALVLLFAGKCLLCRARLREGGASARQLVFGTALSFGWALAASLLTALWLPLA